MTDSRGSGGLDVRLFSTFELSSAGSRDRKPLPGGRNPPATVERVARRRYAALGPLPLVPVPVAVAASANIWSPNMVCFGGGYDEPEPWPN